MMVLVVLFTSMALAAFLAALAALFVLGFVFAQSMNLSPGGTYALGALFALLPPAVTLFSLSRDGRAGRAGPARVVKLEV